MEKKTNKKATAKKATAKKTTTKKTATKKVAVKKKTVKTDISVLLPVHELTDDTRTLFANAVKSIEDQMTKPDAVLIIVPKGSDVFKELSKYDFGAIKSIVTIVENDGKTDFSSQINLGVEVAKTEWVSILELDDEYAKIWFKNVVEYRAAHSDVDMFLPLIVDVNEQTQFIGLTNEAVWAQSFSEEMGILDNGALLTYQNFNIDGSVIKKSLFEDFGGLKSNIKLTFIYEFLLRMTFKDNKIFVIPKFGYKHLNQRVGSLFHSYKAELDPVESKWWLSQAKKEYYFEQDRVVDYEETN